MIVGAAMTFWSAAFILGGLFVLWVAVLIWYLMER